MSAISPAPAPATARRDFAKEKERRQKKLLAGLSVVFLALVGFQLPRLLGGSETETAPAATGTVPAAPQPVVAAPESQLPDTDRVVVEPQSGQLLSFGLFKSKDPFVQQLDPNALTSTTPTSTPPSSSIPQTRPPTAVTPTPPPPASDPRLAPVSFPPSTPSSTPPTPVSTPSPPPPPSTPTPPPPTQPAAPASDVPATTPGTVAISTNGVCEIVALRGTFPGREDIFRVTSIAKDGKSVKIAVVGGAYDGGSATATLKRGEKLTLVNTADGTRYVVRLLAACEVETEAAPTTTTTTSTTPAPSSSAPAVSEPIVEDELDSGSAEDAASQGD